jgi:hypothetical protein
MPFKNLHPLYNVWVNMRQRCTNPNVKQWDDYGGRGIIICDRWNDFHTFVADMGPRPEGYTLDRIDNNRNYEPDNCRWASRKEQQRNRRRAVYVMIEGVRYRAIELAEKVGVKTDTIVDRANKGLPYDEVVKHSGPKDEIIKRAYEAAAQKRKARTHCPHGHEFTPENTSLTKHGHRVCRACHRAKVARQREAKRRSPA